MRLHPAVIWSGYGRQPAGLQRKGLCRLSECPGKGFLWSFPVPRRNLIPIGIIISYGGGIRILRQDLWETILCFLISQNNNITRIRNSVDALCRRYGERLEPEGFLTGEESLSEKDFYSFPEPEKIAAGGLEGLQGLGLGYRDKYILAMAKRCCNGSGKEFFHSLQNADYEEAIAILTGEFGIGRKVADCICLFALHHTCGIRGMRGFYSNICFIISCHFRLPGQKKKRLSPLLPGKK